MNWLLMPGVYRPGFLTAAETTGDHDKDEEIRLKKERHLTQDFRMEGAALLRPGATPPEVYFLQQHYGMPTRLLDWTTSPLAALFFAVCEKRYWDKPGRLFMLDAYQFVHRGGVATEGRKEFREAVRRIFDWADSAGFPSGIFPVRPSMTDIRMIQQRGVFTFHVTGCPVLETTHNRTLTAYQIPETAKKAIERELRLLGVNEFSIYGDLASLAQRLKAAHDVA